MIALFSVWFFSPLTFYRNWNVTEQISLYISSTFAWNKFILRKPHETKIRFHNLFPLKSLHSFRFAYFCFNVTPSGYSHFYPGFLNRIPVRLAIRGGGTSLTAHTHTNKLWIPPKYTHKYLVCILHPHSPPLLLCVWYFLGYFNHASYEIPTDSSISGSLHVTVAMDNDIFSVPFFTLLDQFFRSIFSWHEITPISRILQLMLVSWVEEFSAVKTVFLSCFVWKDTSTNTHTHNKNKSQLDHVSYGMVLTGDVISSLFVVLCWAKRYDVLNTQRTSHTTYPARYLVQSSLLPAATTTTRRIVVDVSARAKSLRK